MTKLATYIQTAEAHGVRTELLDCCQHCYGHAYGGDQSQQRSDQRNQSTRRTATSTSAARSTSRSGQNFGKDYEILDYEPPTSGGPSETSGTCPADYDVLEQASGEEHIKTGVKLALVNVRLQRYLALPSNARNSTAGYPFVGIPTVYKGKNPPKEAWWQVLPAHDQVLKPGTEVTYGTQIRLRHLATNRNLHSHPENLREDVRDDERGELQEVVGFGDKKESNHYDHWLVERADGEPTEDADLWSTKSPVVLRHAQTGRVLSVLPNSKDFQQSVVCCYEVDEDEDRWMITFG